MDDTRPERIDPLVVSIDDLADMLIVGAKGLLATEAAVGLIIGYDYGYWLTRPDFLTRFVDAYKDVRLSSGPANVAHINWDKTYGHLTSGQVATYDQRQRSILLLACSIGGTHTSTVSLYDTVCGLDDVNLYLVLAAIAHLGGASFPAESTTA